MNKLMTVDAFMRNVRELAKSQGTYSRLLNALLDECETYGIDVLNESVETFIEDNNIHTVMDIIFAIEC